MVVPSLVLAAEGLPLLSVVLEDSILCILVQLWMHCSLGERDVLPEEILAEVLRPPVFRFDNVESFLVIGRA